MRQSEVPGRKFSAASQPGDAYGSRGGFVVVVEVVGDVAGTVVLEDVDVVGVAEDVGTVPASPQAAASAARPSAVD